jgi:hypothetical protein
VRSGWGVLGQGQAEGSGHPRSFRCSPSGCRRGLGPSPRPRRGLLVVVGEGMRPALGAGRLAMGVSVSLGSIYPSVVVALRGGGMAWYGDGAVGQAGHRLLGGRWCGVAVLGQIRCSLRGV